MGLRLPLCIMATGTGWARGQFRALKLALLWFDPKSVCVSAYRHIWALEVIGAKSKAPESEKCSWASPAPSLLATLWGDGIKTWPLSTMVDLPAQSKHCPLLPCAESSNLGQAERIVCPTRKSHMMVWGKFWPSWCCNQEVHVEMILKDFVMNLGLRMEYDEQGNMHWCGLNSVYRI